MKVVTDDGASTLVEGNSIATLDSLTRQLLSAAWVFWLVSLALPGFIVATRTEAYTSGYAFWLGCKRLGGVCQLLFFGGHPQIG